MRERMTKAIHWSNNWPDKSGPIMSKNSSKNVRSLASAGFANTHLDHVSTHRASNQMRMKAQGIPFSSF